MSETPEATPATPADERALAEQDRTDRNADVVRRLHEVMAARTDQRRKFKAVRNAHKAQMHEAQDAIADLCAAHDPPLSSIPAPPQTG